MNRSEIKARIANGINDDPDDPVFFDETQFNQLIDESIEFITAETRSIKRTAYVPLRPGATFYTTRSIADDIMLPYRFWNNTTSRRLVATDFTGLDNFQMYWIRTTQNPEYWFPVSWDIFGVWPSPAEAGGVLRIDYLAWPRSLMDDTDEPEMFEATKDAVVLYGRYLGLLKQWDSERAKEVFKELRGVEAIGKARSGIERIRHRSLSHNQNLEFRSQINNGVGP